MNNKTMANAGPAFITSYLALGAIFSFMKLFGLLDWDWTWVLSPVWIGGIITLIWIALIWVVMWSSEDEI